MKVKIESQRIIKPLPLSETHSNSSPSFIPLTVFDKVNYDMFFAFIFAYRPPTPPNTTLELGLRKTLSEFRSCVGRLGKDANGDPIVLLNDHGARFIEASVDSTLDQAIILCEPSPLLQNLHPSLHNVVELVQVQLTRFKCGSLVIGVTHQHLVGDGPSMCKFMAAWCQACQGAEINPLPTLDRTMFTPRNPPRIEFEHRGIEYMSKKQKQDCSSHRNDDILGTRVHFSTDFINQLKIEASKGADKPYSTFESIMAHLWRTMTRARGLAEHETTHVRISVDGRRRMNPRMPNYFGNFILWAFPTSNVKDLLNQPLNYAAKLIHDAVARVDDRYFKSFIDFANYDAKKDDSDLVPTTDANKRVLYPGINVDSWLTYPIQDMDFGTGSPFAFMPTCLPLEGPVLLVPSLDGDGSVDAYVGLFRDHLANFKQICYFLSLSLL